MIFVVENVKKIAVKRMDVIESRELFDDGGEFFVKVCLGELDFSHVELTDSVDCIALVNDGWCLPLGSAEDYIDKVFTRRYSCDLLEIILNHLCRFMPKCRCRDGWMSKTLEERLMAAVVWVKV